MRYKKILVAIDLSSQSDAVFEQAVEIAKKEEASLMLFHFLPIESWTGRPTTNLFGTALISYSYQIQEQWQQEREEARQLLTSYSQKAIAQGVPTQWALKLGDAGSAIRELTEAWGADLVVLGRRGRRGLAEIVLGSVSSYVVHNVPCSVLVVQGISPTADETTEALSPAISKE